MALSDKLQRLAWGLARIPKVQLDKLLGSSGARAFLSDDKKVEIEVRVRNEGSKEPHFLEAGHWTNLAAGEGDVIRKRLAADLLVGVQVKRPKMDKQGKGGNPRLARLVSSFADRCAC